MIPSIKNHVASMNYFHIIHSSYHSPYSYIDTDTNCYHVMVVSDKKKILRDRLSNVRGGRKTKKKMTRKKQQCWQQQCRKVKSRMTSWEVKNDILILQAILDSAWWLCNFIRSGYFMIINEVMTSYDNNDDRQQRTIWHQVQKLFPGEKLHYKM